MRSLVMLLLRASERLSQNSNQHTSEQVCDQGAELTMTWLKPFVSKRF